MLLLSSEGRTVVLIAPVPGHCLPFTLPDNLSSEFSTMSHTNLPAQLPKALFDIETGNNILSKE